MTGMIKLGYKNSWSDQIKNEGERKKTFTAISKRYRLFEGDSTTGSINSPLSPTSIVGVVSISSSIYSSINNQLCQSCTENRYEVCFASTNRCQCPTTDASNMPFGITVTGGCNGSSSTNQTILNAQVDIVLGYNNTLYIGDNMTVAGGNGPGLTANQHYRPTDIFCSRMDGSVYIACANNNRIQKWQTNATFGITIAGNLNGIAGQTPYLMNKTYGIALYYEEKHPYVSDSYNNRIQRFSLR
ncbi:unnamed protein product [Rotaria magnacalcarata]|uniref:Uncharacterized protein n=1 Tax=Rotaria magnacalcarata TaxID=392030 RepID=A0A819LSG3_9BILA|nr:unnamed protein product [Rotaria magnacalcarata]